MCVVRVVQVVIPIMRAGMRAACMRLIMTSRVLSHGRLAGVGVQGDSGVVKGRSNHVLYCGMMLVGVLLVRFRVNSLVIGGPIGDLRIALDSPD